PPPKINCGRINKREERSEQNSPDSGFRQPNVGPGQSYQHSATVSRFLLSLLIVNSRVGRVRSNSVPLGWGYVYSSRMNETIELVTKHGYVLVFFWVLAEQAAIPIPSVPL